MVARANRELIGHIKSNVYNNMRDLYNTAMGTMRYSMNLHQEAINYAFKAYEAHLEGATEVTMPVKLVVR
jgi:hypothetical protein